MPKETERQDVAISAALDGKGISVKARSRFVSAVDRLLGSLLDIASVRIDRSNGRYLAETDIILSIIKEDGEAAKKIIRESGGVGNYTLEMMRREGQIKIENKAKIALETQRLLLESSKNIGDNDESIEIDPDWMNAFTDYAEKASTQTRQEMWARVLARQTQKSNSFSLSTLRVISEISQDRANFFTKIAQNRIGKTLISREQLSGPNLLDLLALQDIGLISEVNGKITREFTAEEGEDDLAIRMGKFAIRFEKTKSVIFDVIIISDIGMEICDILPEQDYKETLRLWARESGRSQIYLSEIIEEMGNRWRFRDIDVINPTQKP